MSLLKGVLSFIEKFETQGGFCISYGTDELQTEMRVFEELTSTHGNCVLCYS